MLAGVRIRFSVPGPGKSEPGPGQRHGRVLKTAAGTQKGSAGIQAVADRGVGRPVIAVRGAGQQPHPVVTRQLTGARIIRSDPAAADVSGQKLQRRIDLTVGQEARVAISERQQSHPPENTRREFGGPDPGPRHEHDAGTAMITARAVPAPLPACTGVPQTT